MINSKDLPLSLRLALQAIAIVSNSHLIVSFNESGFDQLLTLCDNEGLTFVFSNVRD